MPVTTAAWGGMREIWGCSEAFCTLLFASCKGRLPLAATAWPGEVPCSARGSLSLLGQILVPAAVSWGRATGALVSH